MEETRIVVHQSFKYVAEILPSVGYCVMSEMPHKEIAKNLLSNMRASLSVPAMFASMRILRKIQGMCNEAAESFNDGELVVSASGIGKKCHVNFTAERIFQSFCDYMFEKYIRRLETANVEFNPYRDVSQALEVVIAYVAKKQFGIKIK